ncbi:hypothetical protein FRC01_007097, partial [Tulasnella sp. 417]
SGIQVSVSSRTTREAPKAASTPDSAPNKSSGRGQKRKAAAEDDIDEIGFSSLAPPAKTAKRQAAAASSTTRTSQASGSKKKVTFAPGTITSKTAISTSTVAENLLQFSEESEEDDLEDDEEWLEQGLLPPIPHAILPTSTTLQGTSGPGTHHFPSPEEDSDEERWKTMTLAELEAEKESLLIYKALWEREQAAIQAQNNDSPENDELIPRPPGEKGKNGWNLQEALRLKDDGYTYNEILVRQRTSNVEDHLQARIKATTRDAVAMAGLDCTISFRTQDPEKLVNCYARMRLKHSYLTQFKNDWACRELVMNALQNRRKSESARLRSLAGPKPANPIKTSKRKGFNPRPKAAPKQQEEPESTVTGS